MDTNDTMATPSVRDEKSWLAHFFNVLPHLDLAITPGTTPTTQTHPAPTPHKTVSTAARAALDPLVLARRGWAHAFIVLTRHLEIPTDQLMLCAQVALEKGPPGRRRILGRCISLLDCRPGGRERLQSLMTQVMYSQAPERVIMFIDRLSNGHDFPDTAASLNGLTFERPTLRQPSLSSAEPGDNNIDTQSPSTTAMFWGAVAQRLPRLLARNAALALVDAPIRRDHIDMALLLRGAMDALLDPTVPPTRVIDWVGLLRQGQPEQSERGLKTLWSSILAGTPPGFNASRRHRLPVITRLFHTPALFDAFSQLFAPPSDLVHGLARRLAHTQTPRQNASEPIHNGQTSAPAAVMDDLAIALLASAPNIDVAAWDWLWPNLTIDQQALALVTALHFGDAGPSIIDALETPVWKSVAQAPVSPRPGSTLSTPAYLALLQEAWTHLQSQAGCALVNPLDLIAAVLPDETIQAPGNDAPGNDTPGGDGYLGAIPVLNALGEVVGGHLRQRSQQALGDMDVKLKRAGLTQAQGSSPTPAQTIREMRRALFDDDDSPGIEPGLSMPTTNSDAANTRATSEDLYNQDDTELPSPINDADLYSTHSSETASGSESDDPSRLAWRLYRPEDLRARMDAERTMDPGDGQAQYTQLIAQARKHGSSRLLVSLDAAKRGLQRLYKQFPHFTPWLDHLDEHLTLENIGHGVLYLPPSLLSGPPGIGKTFVCRQLARLARTDFHKIGMESVSASFVLTGLSTMWGGGRPGMIYDQMIQGRTANPLFLLDEIDKSAGSSSAPVDQILLPLLEPETAIKFTDEAFPLPLDLRKVIWVGTANDTSAIHSALLSRMECFHIPAPDRNAARSMVRGVYEALREQHAWGPALSPHLSEGVLDVLADALAGANARDLRRWLISAAAIAVKHQRRELVPEDLHDPRSATPKKKIGFL